MVVVCDHVNHDPSTTEDEHMTYHAFQNGTVICDECFQKLASTILESYSKMVLRGKKVQESIPSGDVETEKPFKSYMLYGKHNCAVITDRMGKIPYVILFDYILEGKVGKFAAEENKKVTYTLSASVYVDTGDPDVFLNGEIIYKPTIDHHQLELDFEDSLIVSYADKDNPDPTFANVNSTIMEWCQRQVECALNSICDDMDYADAYTLALSKQPCPCPDPNSSDPFYYSICGDGCEHSTNNPCVNPSTTTSDCLPSCNCPHHEDGTIEFRYPCSQCGHMIDSETALCYYLIGNDIYCLRCAYAFIYKYGIEHHCFDKLGTGVICPCFEDADIMHWCDMMIKTGLFPEIRKVTWENGCVQVDGTTDSTSTSKCPICCSCKS